MKSFKRKLLSSSFLWCCIMVPKHNTETRILTTQSHYKDTKTFIKLSLFTAQYSCFKILRYFQSYFAACNFCAFTASGCSTPTLLRTLQHSNILVGLQFSMKIVPCNDLGHTNNTLLKRHPCSIRRQCDKVWLLQ